MKVKINALFGYGLKIGLWERFSVGNVGQKLFFIEEQLIFFKISKIGELLCWKFEMGGL